LVGKFPSATVDLWAPIVATTTVLVVATTIIMTISVPDSVFPLVIFGRPIFDEAVNAIIIIATIRQTLATLIPTGRLSGHSRAQN